MIEPLLRAALRILCAAACALPAAGSGPADPAHGEGSSTREAALVADLSDGHLDGHTLAEAALIASGILDKQALEAYAARLEGVVGTAVRRAGHRGGPAHRARRLLAELHRGPLKVYQASADGFTRLLDEGSYNCVSATLLYLIAARAAGLQAEAAETPLHVFAVLHTPGGDIEIETTDPRGFDAAPSLGRFRAFVLANKYATEDQLARRGVERLYEEFRGLTRSIKPESVIAFLYYNAGLRALETGDAVAAAGRLVSAGRIYPGLVYRSEDLRTTLAWASREHYDAGRFDEAFLLAETAMRFFPGRTTVKDRFIAVGARVVSEAAGRGDLPAALAAEARVLERVAGDAVAAGRLESHTAPAIARAAVLAHDWMLALEKAQRYSAVTDDPPEADRFARWVAHRAGTAEGASTADLVAEEKAAAAACGAACASVVHAIAALARQGRLEEALAVGRLQAAALAGTGPGEGGDPAVASALDDLLRAAAVRQVSRLIAAHRHADAASAASQALESWPGDATLMGLRAGALSAVAGDPDPGPWRPGPWPANLVAAGGSPARPAPAFRLSGTGPAE